MVLVVPLDEVVEVVFDPLLQLRLLQRDRVTLVGHLHNQLAQFVQLPLDLEETLSRQREPEREEEGGGGQSRGRPSCRVRSEPGSGFIFCSAFSFDLIFDSASSSLFPPLSLCSVLLSS